MARLTKQQIADNEAAEAQLKLTQQAELKRLRAEKRKLKAMITPAPEAKAFDPAAEDAARQAKIASAFDVLMDSFELPSWKRTLCALVLGCATAFGVGYLVGMIAGTLIVGAVALTGMAWVGYVVAVLGVVLAAIAGGKVGNIVACYVLDKKVDLHFGVVKNKVTGWFKRPAIVQFSGAHAA